MSSSAADAAPLARGRTADVYAWGDRQVLKLFRAERRETVEYEARLSQVAYAAGLPVPAPGDVIEVDGRYGILFERIDGVTMLRHVVRRPWTVRQHGALLGRLHRALHERPAPELRPAKDRLRRLLEGTSELPENLRDPALRLLAHLPDGDRLLHGDFHPDNVLLTARGPVIIDWIDATRGHPLADVARSHVLMTVGSIQNGGPMRWMAAALRGAFRRAYSRRYFQGSPQKHAELLPWIAVVAAARLRERIPGERARLLELVRAAL